MYGGSSFLTTAEIARTLLRLAIGASATGSTELVEVPIAVPGLRGSATAELVIGSGIPLLSLPADWEGDEPDFSTEAMMLQMRSSYPRPAVEDPSLRHSTVDNSELWNPDFEDW